MVDSAEALLVESKLDDVDVEAREVVLLLPLDGVAADESGSDEFGFEPGFGAAIARYSSNQ